MAEDAPIDVLLIEDDDAHAELVQRHLARSRAPRMKVTRANRLAGAMELLARGGGFAVVLLDLGLPDSVGPVQTLDRVLAKAPEVPVVVLTSIGDLEQAVEVVHKGAQDHIVKTQISTELLVRSIRYAIERKSAERAVRASERLYRAVGESINYGVWVCDASGRNTYASPSFLKMAGITQEQCSSFGWADLLHPDDRDRTLAAWRDCVASGGTWDIEHRFRGVNGEWVSLLARGVPVRNDQGQVTAWAGINLDISNIKRVQEELRQLNETLERRVAERTEAVELKSQQLRQAALELTHAEQRERQRLARVLHDHIQQLLVAAKMQLDLEATAPDVVQQAATQAVDLISQAINASRSLTFELYPPVLYERGLGAALGRLAQSIREQHGMTVHVETAPGAEPVQVLRGFLFEAVRELLFNAVKHAGVKEAFVRLKRLDAQTIVVEVEDHGRGFTPTAVSASDSGTHFGLFSIRERLSLLGARFDLHSAPGAGTHVTLRAPSEQEAATAPAVARPAPGAHAAAGPTPPAAEPDRRIRVLLADDHQILRESLAGRLTHESDLCIIGQASDGQMAVEMAKSLRPDVVLMDIGMPRLDGIAATRAITAEQPEMCIIGLSMHESKDVSDAMSDAGAVAFVSKTQPVSTLITTIRQHARAAD